MTSVVLVLNVGSSSVKFALFEHDESDPVLRGAITGIGTQPRFDVSGSAAAPFGRGFAPPACADHEAHVRWLLKTLCECVPDLAISAAGHRVVHGGAHFDQPVLVDAAMLAELATLVPLAPNHQPNNLAAIHAVAQAWPALPQVACFDTAFHRSQPRLAQLFALPRALSDAGIVRYGFHGLSYQYIAGVLPRFAGVRADGRVIVAHLGHGASLCALHGRRSVATTMGFTSLDGLMMGKRCGAIDPGVLLHLLRAENMTVEAVADLLNNRCGLFGVSGISDDVRVLESSEDPHAREALDLFAYRAAGELGALCAALGGLDVLVFTAGIGEHAATMRARICERLHWLGVRIDDTANATHGPRISSPSSSVDVHVIPTDEENVIAQATFALTAASPGT